MAIHLGHGFPEARAAYPVPRRAASAGPASPCTGRGLASRRVATVAGGLLPHRFTLADPEPGGLLSVPLSVGFRRLGFPSVLPCGVRTFLGRPEPSAATRPALSFRSGIAPARALCRVAWAARVISRLWQAPRISSGTLGRSRPGARSTATADAGCDLVDASSRARAGRERLPAEPPGRARDPEYRDLTRPKVAVGDIAPDFELPLVEGGGAARLTSSFASDPWPSSSARTPDRRSAPRLGRSSIWPTATGAASRSSPSTSARPTPRTAGSCRRTAARGSPSRACDRDERLTVATTCAANLRMQMPWSSRPRQRRRLGVRRLARQALPRSPRRNDRVSGRRGPVRLQAGGARAFDRVAPRRRLTTCGRAAMRHPSAGCARTPRNLAPVGEQRRHSGQASTPRSRITNSPHARHSRLAPRESASNSWSSVLARDATTAVIAGSGTPPRPCRGSARDRRRSARAPRSPAAGDSTVCLAVEGLHRRLVGGFVVTRERPDVAVRGVIAALDDDRVAVEDARLDHRSPPLSRKSAPRPIGSGTATTSSTFSSAGSGDPAATRRRSGR